jgi:hypothetical protein
MHITHLWAREPSGRGGGWPHTTEPLDPTIPYTDRPCRTHATGTGLDLSYIAYTLRRLAILTGARYPAPLLPPHLVTVD